MCSAAPFVVARGSCNAAEIALRQLAVLGRPRAASTKGRPGKSTRDHQGRTTASSELHRFKSHQWGNELHSKASQKSRADWPGQARPGHQWAELLNHVEVTSPLLHDRVTKLVTPLLIHARRHRGVPAQDRVFSARYPPHRVKGRGHQRKTSNRTLQSCPQHRTCSYSCRDAQTTKERGKRAIGRCKVAPSTGLARVRKPRKTSLERKPEWSSLAPLQTTRRPYLQRRGARHE